MCWSERLRSALINAFRLIFLHTFCQSTFHHPRELRLPREREQRRIARQQREVLNGGYSEQQTIEDIAVRWFKTRAFFNML